MIVKTVHLAIEGKVQGVFYRASAKEIADEIGVKGWVRNTEQGNVEITLTGTDDQINDFVSWCWKGPRRAEVTNISKTAREYESFDSFNIIK